MRIINNQIKKIVVMAFLTVFAVGNKAQEHTEMLSARFTTWTNEMQTIARNNPSLKAKYSQLEATRIANSAENRLPDPSAEVAYLFGSPKSVPNRTNVSVSQVLDWGVLTGHRKRLSKAANNVAEATYRVEFQKVMAEADELLVRMVYYNQLCNELEMRCKQAREMQQLFEKKFSNGDVNALELNKIRLQLSMSETELQRAKTERNTVSQSLNALNGGVTMSINDTLYPVSTSLPSMELLKESLQQSPQMQQAHSSIVQSEEAIKLAKVESMPELSIGFQGEYIKDNNYSGPSLGLSIPLWGSGRRKVKAAKAEKVARQLDLTALQQQQSATLCLLYNQAKEQIATSDKLRSDLSSTTNDTLLRRSLDAGQISLLNYLLEQSFYYSARTAQLEAERDAQLAVSKLRALMY